MLVLVLVVSLMFIIHIHIIIVIMLSTYQFVSLQFAVRSSKYYIKLLMINAFDC